MGKKISKKNRLPEIAQLEIIGMNENGELLAKTVLEKDNPKNLEIVVLENRKIKPELAAGDLILAKLAVSYGEYYAKPISRLKMKVQQLEKHYGVVQKQNGKAVVASCEKNAHETYLLDSMKGVKFGDFVSFVLEGERRFKTVRILKSFGAFDLHQATSFLVLEKYDIPYQWNDKVLKETKKMKKFSSALREDLTNLPFVTIDGDDSKDFDDAVWAERTPLGFRLGIAIADVGFYVRHLSELDREAYKRGNSVYLPNVTVPMLPEILCNDLCSLRPRVKRPVLACFIDINHDGEFIGYDFCRGVICSAERLTYPEVQKALDGQKNEKTQPIFEKVIVPLFEAYQALDKARKKRGALELESSEFKVKFDRNGKVKALEKRVSVTSEKIVEEFMIAANVAAALALKKSKLPVMYRVHDKPKTERLDDLKELLKSFKMKLPQDNALRPEHFNKVLDLCKEHGLHSGINDMVLRMQSQAQYSPHNIGHFGLGLKDYVHFTSPIRRYADVLIHRALIRALNLPDGGGLEDGADEKLFEQIGTHISETERKAVSAEREMIARFQAEYLAPSIGQIFDVSISGLSNAGIFVRIDELGAEGLVPMRSLPNDNYILAENKMSLRGMKTKRIFAFGERIKAILKEANPTSGGMVFAFYDE